MVFLDPLVGSQAHESVANRLESKGLHWPSKVFPMVVWGCSMLPVLLLVVLLGDTFLLARPLLTDRLAELFSFPMVQDAPEFSGFFNALRGTFWIGLFVVGFSFPLGIASAVYLEEYASDTKLTRFIRLVIRNLAGVPSVVYGILGLAVFVGLLKGVYGDVASSQSQTMIAGGLTLAVLSLPVVIITASEAIRAVPSSIREAAYGVGASQPQVIRSHVLPYAAPGIFTGTLLSLARALGETAPLIVVGAQAGRFSSRTGFFDVSQVGEKFTAMPVLVMDTATRLDVWHPFSAAAIVVLLGIVLSFTIVAIVLRNRFEKKRGS